MGESVKQRFPVLQAVYGGHKLTIPWAVIAPHERQADANHGQSLARLAERGGLSWCELAAVIEDRKWAPMSLDAAHEAVMLRVSDHLRALTPESGSPPMKSPTQRRVIT